MSDSLPLLIADVARLLRRRFDERHEGTTQGSLAELLEVEPITLCRMIDRLEEAGHVERRRSPNDRRAWNIYLIDRSRPLLGELRGIGDAVTELALAGLDAGERDALGAALLAVRGNLAEPRVREAAHG